MSQAEEILKKILVEADVSLEQAKDGSWFLGFDYSYADIDADELAYVQGLMPPLMPLR